MKATELRAVRCPTCGAGAELPGPVGEASPRRCRCTRRVREDFEARQVGLALVVPPSIAQRPGAQGRLL